MGRTEQGTALIEFTLIFPILLMLMVNGINFGLYMYAWVTVSNAARAAAEYQSYNGVAVGFPAMPSYGQVSSPLFTTDTSSLPNSAPTLTICRKNADGSVTLWGGSGSCSGIPADPEPAAFALWYVTVSYTYQQWAAPNLLTIYTLPTTVQQTVLMRSMQ